MFTKMPGKRFISALLCAVLLFNLLPAPTYAADGSDEAEGGYKEAPWTDVSRSFAFPAIEPDTGDDPGDFDAPETDEQDEAVETDETEETDEILADQEDELLTLAQEDGVMALAEGNAIQSITVRWTGTEERTRELRPESDDVETHQFQINATLEGTGVYGPGEIRIEIPAHLWFDRDGNPYGNVSLPFPEAPDTSMEYSWTLEGDTIVITNNRSMDAKATIMIQGSVSGMQAHLMENEAESVDFNATITVAGESMTGEEPINAQLFTKVEVANVSKSAQDPMTGKYSIWWHPENGPDGMPSELLDGRNPEEYVFVRWYVMGQAKGSQPFTMTITDKDISDDRYGGIVLGMSDLPNGKRFKTAPIDGEVIFEGYDLTPQTAYVWTAYPISELEKLTDEEQKKLLFHNEQTITVTGKDDNKPDSKSTDATVNVKMPTTYTFIKIWDDEEDAAGYRGRVDIFADIYDRQTGKNEPYDKVKITAAMADLETDPKGNTWIYTWTDEGDQNINFWVDESMANYTGQIGDVFNQDGNNQWWQYNKSDDTGKVGTEHTWVFTNTLTEFFNGTPSNIYKEVRDYNDPKVDSTKDSALNLLRSMDAGGSVLVPYRVYTTLSSTAASLYGATPNTFRLEDGDYTLESQRVGVEDVSVGAITVYEVTATYYDLTGFDGTIPKDQNGKDVDVGFPVRERTSPEYEIWGTVYGEDVLFAKGRGAGLYDIANGAEQPSNNGSRIILPDGVSKIWLTTDSDAQSMYIDCEISMRVHASEKIKTWINDALERDDVVRFALWNRAASRVTYSGADGIEAGGKTWHQGDEVSTVNVVYDHDTGFLHGRDYKVAADLAKSFEHIDRGMDPDKNIAVDDLEKSFLLRSTLTLTQQSNVVTQSEYARAIAAGEIPNTREGVYYDLLPAGVEPDLSSIKLSDGDTLTGAWTMGNYKDSGRTLLIATVSLADRVSYQTELEYSEIYDTYPTEGYRNQHTLTFDSYYPYDVMMNEEDDGSGFFKHNVAAFGATDGQVGTLKGWEGAPNEPDSNHSLTGNAFLSGSDEEEWMTRLPEFGEGQSFVYAGDEEFFNKPNVFATVSLKKEVSAAGSGIWSDGSGNDVNVQEGGGYIYRLNITNISNDTDQGSTGTSGIIVLDFLEEADRSKTLSDDGYRWQGNLVSVDVSQLRSLGVAPVVYYTTAEGLDEDGISRLVSAELKAYLEDRSNGWTSNPDEINIADVTAIAVDATTAIGGGVFTLAKDNNLLIYLHMRAPYDKNVDWPDYFDGGDVDEADRDGTQHEKNAHAYNDFLMVSVHGSVDGEGGKDETIKSDPTKVGIFTKVFDVEKVWDDNDDVDGKRPPWIDVSLNADIGLENPVDTVRLSEETGWQGKFARVLTYDEATGDRIQYTFEEAFAPGYDKGDYTLTVNRTQDAEGNLSITLTNRHEPEKISVPFEKEWTSEQPGNALPASVTVRLYADGVFTGRSYVMLPDKDGNWSGVFANLNRYRDHGKTIKYTIEELYPGDYIPSYVYVYVDDESNYWDAAVGGNPVDMDDDGNFILPENPTEGDGPAGGDGPAEDGQPKRRIAAVLVTNTYQPKGVLKVFKKLENANSDEARDTPFTFDLALTWPGEDGEEDKALIDKYPYAIYNEDGTPATNEEDEPLTGTIGHGDTFTIKGGQYIVVYNLPNGAHYAVSERSAAGFTQAKIEGGEGEIRASLFDPEDPGADIGYPAKAEFTNRYRANGSVQLRALKTLTGRASLDRYQFRFELRDAEGNVLLSAYNSACPAKDGEGNDLCNGDELTHTGSVTFGQLRFTEADVGKGEFVYTIHEVNDGKDGYTYDDETVYTVYITPHDNGDGTMSFDVEIYGPNGEDDTDEPEEPNELDEPGDEEEPEEPGEPEHQHESKLIYRASYNNGVLAEESKHGDWPEFENEYEAEGSISLRSWKTLTNGNLAGYDGEFTFDLYQYPTPAPTATPEPGDEPGENPSGKPGEAPEEDGLPWEWVGSAVNSAGNVVFEPMSEENLGGLAALNFTQLDAGKTYYFFLRERAGGDQEIEYSKQVYCYSVEVIDNGDGTLSFNQQTYDVTCETCLGSGLEPAPETEETPETGDAPETGEQPEQGTDEEDKPCAVCGGLGFVWSFEDAEEWEPQGEPVIPLVENKMKPGYLTLTKYTEDGKRREFMFYVELFGDVPNDLDVEFQTAEPKEEGYWEQYQGDDAYGPPMSEPEEAPAPEAAAEWIAVQDYAVPLAGLQGSGEKEEVAWTLIDGVLRLSPTNGVSGSVSFTGAVTGAPWYSSTYGGLGAEVQSLVTSVVVDEGVTLKGTLSNMFSGYTELKTVDFSKATLSPTSYSGGLNYMFEGCKNLQSVTIGAVTSSSSGSISLSHTFDGCENLKTIDFGNDFIYYGLFTYDPFKNCNSLRYVYFGSVFFNSTSSIDLPTPTDNKQWAKIDTIGMGDDEKKSTGKVSERGWWVLDDTPATYTISYDKGATDGSVANSMPGDGGMNNDPITWNAYVYYSIETNVYERPEYRFIGWVIDGDPDEVLYPDGGVIPAKVFDPNEAYTPSNIKLIAQWESTRTDYTIEFDKGEHQEASGNERSDSNEAAEDYTIPAPRFMTNGYQQIGWTIEGDESGTVYMPGDIIPAGTYKPGTTITLVAVWKETSLSRSDGENGWWVKVPSGMTAVIGPLPAGVSYKIYEVLDPTDDAGWILVDPIENLATGTIPANGTVEAGTNADAKFHNLYRRDISTATVTLTGLKLLDGKATEGFTFNLEKLDPVTQQYETVGEPQKSGLDGFFSFTIEYDEEDAENVYTYRITEDREKCPEGLDADAIDFDSTEIYADVEVKKDDAGNLTANVLRYYRKSAAGGEEEIPVIFDNITKPGTLKVWKTISGNQPDNVPSFEAQVQMFTPDGPPASGEIFEDDKGGKYPADENGCFTVRIAPGKENAITFIDLPAGTTYKIVEINLPGGWMLDDDLSSDPDGIIQAGQDAQMQLHNTYSTSRKRGGEGGGVVIEVRKKYDFALEPGMFSFMLVEVDEDGNVIDGEEGLTLTASNAAPDSTGTAPVIFSIDYDEPGMYYYRITEIGDDPMEGVIYDAGTVLVTVKVTDNGDGTLSAKVISYEYENEDGEIVDEVENVFYNKRRPGTGQLTVTKTLQNATKAAGNVEFTFTVNIWESEEKKAAGEPPLNGPFTVLKYDKETGKTTQTEITDADNTVAIKGGEWFTVEDLPEGAYYEVTEAGNNGFELADMQHNTGTISGEEPKVEASFTNAYSSEGGYVFVVRKRIDGKTFDQLTEPLPEGTKFTFELLDANNEVIETVDVGPDGIASFTKLEFNETHDGQTFLYRIREVSGTNTDPVTGEDPYVYDGQPKTISLVVTDKGDGTMTVLPANYDPANPPSYEYEFNNATQDSLVGLTLIKTVAGSMGDRTESFEFTLKLSHENMGQNATVKCRRNDGPEEEITLDRSGSYSFMLGHGDKIEFTGLREGTTFTITEQSGMYKASGTVTTDETESFPGAEASGTLNGDVTVEFENRLDGVVPTGVPGEARWAISLLALSLAGALWLVMRRRRYA